MEGAKFRFKTKLWSHGGSIVAIIPKAICEDLELASGQTIFWVPDRGKWGKFAALWNPQQQDERGKRRLKA